MTHKIMVYGTLMSGFAWNERLLKDKPNAKFIGKATTKEKYYLFASGIPYLSRTGPGDGTPIVGEVYEVDDAKLVELDQLEQHPRWYTRTPITVLIKKKEVEVEVYFINKEPDSPGVSLVSTGDYRAFSKKNKHAKQYATS